MLTLLESIHLLQGQSSFYKRVLMNVEVLTHTIFLSSNILPTVPECSCARPKYFPARFPLVLTQQKLNHGAGKKNN